MSEGRRGHPSRIRKPNPKFDDSIVYSSPSPRSRKNNRPVSISTPTKQNVIQNLFPDEKRSGQMLGVRLRNLLKLPKAHKWVCYEWFYGNIDEPLFKGENDFQLCLKESFPQLKTRMLRRVEWCRIRKLMGKPRRCSPAFFDEERDVLYAKRQKMRLLQQKMELDLSECKDLPFEIPLPLVIGTRVTARLREPQDGLFSGVIDAVDTQNNSYRVMFDRAGLGTHLCSDWDVLSTEPVETMPLASLCTTKRLYPRPATTPIKDRITGNVESSELDYDPLLGASPVRHRPLLKEHNGMLGNFPIKFLKLMSRLSRILKIKKKKVHELKELNTEAEKEKSVKNGFSPLLQHKYASLILELEKINKDLNEYLVGVQQYWHEMSPDYGVAMLEQSSRAKQASYDKAQGMVDKANNVKGHPMAGNPRIIPLIVKLTSLLLQVKAFAEMDMENYELHSIQDTIQELKTNLQSNNVNTFQNEVEVHMNHILSGLSRTGNLQAFATVANYDDSIQHTS